ncbi:diphthine--ammonia ligase [Malassezia brasiliensis]|uniref:Diphthine--ammonia ligase n=1 Tax=Malassezia brasiliensis TaxID=1821822 RepID=A0AAF0DUB8_9BASI|nr:diphthine--ammonia ligase [Malassezia brasiliensis]
MKVVGLLSGGKDSCFNLCHCVLQGHEVVAVATLAPPGGKDEIDSYMYQTVGHDAVQAVADALQVPLYRACITGTAVNQDAVYGARDPATSGAQAGDETEDLYRLLQTVKAAHPDVQGVSVGAILSNYQRVRVEHVVRRNDLQLQPLAFLWQRNQAHLLDEMVRSGLVAVLLKVAGIGLTERDLGKTLQQMQPKLLQLNALYGAHICGEGGEYETLTIDAPLFVKQIAIHQTETVVHADAAFASVSYLRVQKTELVPKPPGSFGQDAVRAALQAPPLLDPMGEHTYAVARTYTGHRETDTVSMAAPPAEPLEPAVNLRGAWLAVGDVTGVPNDDFAQETHSAMTRLADALTTHGFSMTDVCHVNVYLASQSLFPAFNAVYCTFFGAAPPSRACVGVSLGTGGARVAMDAVAFHDTHPSSRRALHVQSLSYWAPANIGPYSQAVCTDHRIWIAGQIGMEPATLRVPPDEALQLALALQHVRRIVLAVREWSYAQSEGYVEGGLCWVASRHADALGAAVAQTWREACATSADDDAVHAHQQGVDDTTWLGESRTPESMPLLLVRLADDALPKHAAVEWQLTASVGRSRFVEAEDDEAYATPEVGAGSFVRGGVRCTYRLSHVPRLDTFLGVATLEAVPGLVQETDETADIVSALLTRALHVRLVHSSARAEADALLSRVAERCATAHIPALGWALPGCAWASGPGVAGVVFVG